VTGWLVVAGAVLASGVGNVFATRLDRLGVNVRQGSFARPEAITLPLGGDGPSFTSPDHGDNDR
jgi:hypothetical protein